MHDRAGRINGKFSYLLRRPARQVSFAEIGNRLALHSHRDAKATAPVLDSTRLSLALVGNSKFT
jgi:hypothetical protein